MVLSIAGMHPRSLSVKILFLGTSLTFLLFLYLYTTGGPWTSFSPENLKGPNWVPGTCPPRGYSNGRWRPYHRSNAQNMTDKTQALVFSGFEGCASSREFDWHLASDNEEQWDRFPGAQSYLWDVGKADGCENMEEFNKEKVVRDLVEQGGWMLLGDSITEGHFFSLSCMLFPHVIATPTYTPNSYFDRAWPQNLYLNPDSPLLRPSTPTHKQLTLPPGFNISTTALVTFRRIDLLFTQLELVDIHNVVHPNPPTNFSLFSEEAAWSISPSEYMPLFLKGGYSTMVVSTAGHWTTTLFGAYGDDAPVKLENARQGLDGVIDFFGHAMRKWADGVQRALKDADMAEGGKRKRQVLVRAYLPGHEDCHKARTPWEKIQPFVWSWYNWGRIWEFNEVFEVRGFVPCLVLL